MKMSFRFASVNICKGLPKDPLTQYVIFKTFHCKEALSFTDRLKYAPVSGIQKSH